MLNRHFDNACSASHARACYRPAAAILRDVETYVMTNAPRLTPKDVKDFIVAFSAMEAPPSPEMVNSAILQLPGHFKDTLPKDLALLITVRISMLIVMLEAYLLLALVCSLHSESRGPVGPAQA